MATYREDSREEWVSTAKEKDDDLWKQSQRLTVGCLQRIADACEAMRGTAVTLEGDPALNLDYWKKQTKSMAETNRLLRRRIAGLKGYVKRLKAKEK